MAEKKIDFPGFVGPTNVMRVERYDAQRTVNLYLEMNALPNGKEDEPAILIGTPGLQFANTIGPGPIRALYVPSNNPNLMIVVSGGEVFSVVFDVTNDSNIVNIGSMKTSSGFVSFADNGISTMFVDGQYGYYINNTATVPAPGHPLAVVDISDPNFYPSATISYQDGYFILSENGTEFFFLSSPFSTSFYALNTANKSGNSDNIVCATSNNRELYLFGTQTTEIWWDSGNSGVTPFQRQDGKFINFGCISGATVVKLDNTLFWLGNTLNGQGIVLMLQGDTAIRVSNHAIEHIINGATDLQNSTAYGYLEEGHFFYVLNIVSLNTTLVYDATAQAWHERQSFDASTQLQDRHLAQVHTTFLGNQVMGSYDSSVVYFSSLEYYKDDLSSTTSQPITRLRQSPHVSENLNRIFYKLFEVDLRFGEGLNGNTYIPGDGTDPQIMLQISNNGGETWGNEIWRKVGKIGKYYARARWSRLGSSRDRIFRIIFTDPIPFAILSAKIDVEEGQA